MFTAALLVALSLTPSTAPAMTLTKADSGKTITIAANEDLQIELGECGSCGYRWRTTIKPDRKVLTRRPQVHKDPTCEPPCVGGGYMTVFRYVGNANGRTKLRLEYFGPGKKKSSGTFRVTVRVR